MLICSFVVTHEERGAVLKTEKRVNLRLLCLWGETELVAALDYQF